MLQQLSFLINSSLALEFGWCPRGTVKIQDLTFTFTKGFWISKTSITNGQWRAVMGNSHLKIEDDDIPIFRIDYSETITFINNLNKLVEDNVYGENIIFRLPNEAELRYAAKANTTTKWFWGDDGNEIVNYGWFEENSNNHVHKVATKNPNPWGLFDLYGNVLELCYEFLIDNNHVVDPKSNFNLSDEAIPVFGGYYGEAVDSFLARQKSFISVKNSYAEDVGFRLIYLG